MYYKALRVADALEFHLEGVLLNLIFLYMAKIWAAFVREWSLVEKSMKYYEGPKNAKIKIVVAMVSIMGLALCKIFLLQLLQKLKKFLVEHALVTSQIAWTSIRNNPLSFFNASREYFVHHEFVEVFHYVPYSIWTGLFFKVCHFILMLFLLIFLFTNSY